MLILTHENADFDAIASLLAASKLYPGGMPMLPRRVNRNVEKFLTLYWDIFPFLRPGEWQRQQVEQVILVDTQHITAVRGMIPDPHVQVFDHHEQKEERENWEYHIDPVGATTTLLVERIKAAGLAISAEEATLFLLGVHEDTGSLTYPSTTVRDVWAAGWLMEQGALLPAVRRFLRMPFTAVQRDLYEQLLQNVRWLESGGQTIALTTAIAPPAFDDEISPIAHRLRDLIPAAALFVLVKIGRNNVQLVARSGSEQIDVAFVAAAMGGGGHKRAAAAMIVSDSLTAVSAQIEALLPQAVTPITTVSALMSYGSAHTIPVTATIAEAAAMVLKLGHEGYPVVDVENGRLVGLLTRRAVDRAMAHQYGDKTVRTIMKAGRVTVTEDDSIERVQQLMLTEEWGQIPVVGAGGDVPLVGIITRTDILTHLFQPKSETAVIDMRHLLESQFPPALWRMAVAIGEMAAELHLPLYFVGGLVRDALMHKSPTDLDMVVEGDAIALATALQKKYGGHAHVHERFGTAKWGLETAVWQKIAGDGTQIAQMNTDSRRLSADTPSPKSKAEAVDADVAMASTNSAAAYDDLPDNIDFITARAEFYTKPTVLPEVESGSIKLDLHRRDFTINTLAVRLDGAHLGELIDFYNGLRDLENKTIRVLHSLSFVDDPTRILRGLRLGQRLGFEIEPRTAELMESSLSLLARVSGSRIRHEIELALMEQNPAQIMARFCAAKVLTAISPTLRWRSVAGVAMARVAELSVDGLWKTAVSPDDLLLVRFALWMVSLPAEVQETAMTRLMVRKVTREVVTGAAGTLAALDVLPDDALASVVDQQLRPFMPLSLFVARVYAGQSPLLDRYYGEWRGIETAVNGADIRALGLRPSPAYGRILETLRAARLDGVVQSDDEERALLRKLVGAEGE
jgi:tRNA nucleotidyltransferase (CCA-adding enzyme)